MMIVDLFLGGHWMYLHGTSTWLVLYLPFTKFDYSSFSNNGSKVIVAITLSYSSYSQNVVCWNHRSKKVSEQCSSNSICNVSYVDSHVGWGLNT